MSEQMAVIRDVGFGCRDVGKPVLWFTTYTSEHSAALQVLYGDDVAALITDSGVYEVHDLNGKPCWVESGNGLIRFLRVWKQ